MEDTRRGKPDPEVFLLAARKLGIEPQRCIVLEDAPVGIQAAKAGGMHAVGVAFVGHHPAEKLRAAGADLVVPSWEGVGVQQLTALL
jgi:beta-phosphoglucomutase